MKLDKKMVFVLVVVALFLGSIFATAFMGGNRSNNNSNNTDINSIDNLPTEYYFTETETTISSIFPQLVLTALPTEYDQKTVEDNFNAVDGIKKVTTNFSETADGNIALIANIIYDEDKKEEVLESINNLDFILEKIVYQRAIANLDGQITFTDDKNTTKDYVFKNQKVETIVNITSENGDKIKGNINAIFKGNTLVNVNIIETQNLSSGIQLLFLEKEFDIKSWNPIYRVEANTNYDSDIDENAIIFVFKDYNVSISNTFTNTISYNLNEDTNKEELSAFLQNIKDENNSIIEQFDVDSNNNYSLIGFNADNLNKENYINFKENIKTNFNLDNNNINEDVILTYLIDIVLEDNLDTEEVTNYINELNLELKNIKKQADIDVSNIVIEEEQYTFNSEILPTFLEYPKNKDITKLNFNVQGYHVRNDIMYLSLTEIENEENQTE